MTPDELAYKITDLQSVRAKYEERLSVAYGQGSARYDSVYARLNPKLQKIIKKIETYKKILAAFEKTTARAASGTPFNARPSGLSKRSVERLRYMLALMILLKRHSKASRASLRGILPKSPNPYLQLLRPQSAQRIVPAAEHLTVNRIKTIQNQDAMSLSKAA